MSNVDVFSDLLGVIRAVLQRNDWTLPERMAAVLMFSALHSRADVSCFTAYGAAVLDHDDVDPFIGRALAAAPGHTVLYSDDGHVLVTKQSYWDERTLAHLAETGHDRGEIEVIETHTCTDPACGEPPTEMRYRAIAGTPPAAVAGGSAPTSSGITSRRVARKRARQARKRGRR